MANVDPHFSSVTVLCPLTSNANSVGAMSGVTVYIYGGSFTNARYKFETGSYLLPGSTDYIRVDTPAALPAGTEDFTIEGWLNIDSWYNTINTIANLYQSASQGWRLVALTTGQVRIESLDDFQAIYHPSTLTLDTWFHWAVTRDSNGLRCWIDGVPSNYLATTASYAPYYLYLGVPGWSTGADEVNGYYNELRVTKGLCRYSAAFTPPTTIFPRFGAVIEGVVTDQNGNPAQRTLRCYIRDTGVLLDSTTSNAVTGAYALGVAASGEYQIVALDDASGLELNDLIRRVQV